MTSKQVKWNWSKECQKAFDTIKRLDFRESLLSCPNFNKPFEIHTDVSKVQLGSIISQKDEPIAFYNRKLNPALVKYATSERKLLSIVKTLKGFGYILLGQQIKAYADHETSTCETFNA